MQVLQKLIRFARRSRREQLRVVRGTVRYHLIERGWKIPHLGNDRTAYVIGLFGTGRSYVNELMLQNIGERAKYFRDDDPLPSRSDIYDLQRPCHNEACFSQVSRSQR